MDAAEGTATLAHEIGHVILGHCESRAERWAMGHWRSLYRALGFGRPTATGIDYVRRVNASLSRVYSAPC